MDNDALAILEQAKEANPHWFKAMLQCADIMVDRRKKYSGNHHPMFNFVSLARITGLAIHQVFMFYVGIKIARLSASTEDFQDESAIDCVRDLANYALIMLGWMIDKLTFEDVDNWSQAEEFELTIEEYPRPHPKAVYTGRKNIPPVNREGEAK